MISGNIGVDLIFMNAVFMKVYDRLNDIEHVLYDDMEFLWPVRVLKKYLSSIGCEEHLYDFDEVMNWCAVDNMAGLTEVCEVFLNSKCELSNIYVDCELARMDIKNGLAGNGRYNYLIRFSKGGYDSDLQELVSVQCLAIVDMLNSVEAIISNAQQNGVDSETVGKFIDAWGVVLEKHLPDRKKSLDMRFECAHDELMRLKLL